MSNRNNNNSNSNNINNSNYNNINNSNYINNNTVSKNKNNPITECDCEICVNRDRFKEKGVKLTHLEFLILVVHTMTTSKRKKQSEPDKIKERELSNKELNDLESKPSSTLTQIQKSRLKTIIEEKAKSNYLNRLEFELFRLKHSRILNNSFDLTFTEMEKVFKSNQQVFENGEHSVANNNNIWRLKDMDIDPWKPLDKSVNNSSGGYKKRRNNQTVVNLEEEEEEDNNTIQNNSNSNQNKHKSSSNTTTTTQNGIVVINIDDDDDEAEDKNKSKNDDTGKNNDKKRPISIDLDGESFGLHDHPSPKRAATTSTTTVSPTLSDINKINTVQLSTTTTTISPIINATTTIDTSRQMDTKENTTNITPLIEQSNIKSVTTEQTTTRTTSSLISSIIPTPPTPPTLVHQSITTSVTSDSTLSVTITESTISGNSNNDYGFNGEKTIKPNTSENLSSNEYIEDMDITPTTVSTPPLKIQPIVFTMLKSTSPPIKPASIFEPIEAEYITSPLPLHPLPNITQSAPIHDTTSNLLPKITTQTNEIKPPETSKLQQIFDNETTKTTSITPKISEQTNENKSKLQDASNETLVPIFKPRPKPKSKSAAIAPTIASTEKLESKFQDTSDVTIRPKQPSSFALNSSPDKDKSKSNTESPMEAELSNPSSQIPTLTNTISTQNTTNIPQPNINSTSAPTTNTTNIERGLLLNPTIVDSENIDDSDDDYGISLLFGEDEDDKEEINKIKEMERQLEKKRIDRENNIKIKNQQTIKELSQKIKSQERIIDQLKEIYVNSNKQQQQQKPESIEQNKETSEFAVKLYRRVLKDYTLIKDLVLIDDGQDIQMQDQDQQQAGSEEKLKIEFIKFMVLKIIDDDINVFSETKLIPSPMVQRFWEELVLDSVSYKQFTMVLGYEINFKIEDRKDLKNPSKRQEIRDKYKRTRKLYKKYFSVTELDDTIWSSKYFKFKPSPVPTISPVSATIVKQQSTVVQSKDNVATKKHHSRSQSSSPSPSASPPNNSMLVETVGKLNIKFKSHRGHTFNFQLDNEAPLALVFETYCENHKLLPKNVEFQINNEKVTDSDQNRTPIELKMKTNDIIKAVIKYR